MYDLNEIVSAIEALPTDWHGSGTISGNVLRAITRHCLKHGDIQHSMETGSGKSTLLFSHISKHHLVFSKDDGNSITRVRESPLFLSERVEFIEGPTQKTLPQFKFSHKIDVALIDGPHGYPFPDMEYYYIYQTLRVGSILIVDDIQIPTIRRMYEILKVEDMFEHLEVGDNTAFFKRTEHEVFNPYGDGWWLQGYNKPHYNELTAS